MLDQCWTKDWIERAVKNAGEDPLYRDAISLQRALLDSDVEQIVCESRLLCTNGSTPIVAAYGGYYYSPLQSLHLDYLRRTLPTTEPHRHAALAALVQTGSVCAASPGHTAQPFKPTASAGPFLKDAWLRRVPHRVKEMAAGVCIRAARVPGEARNMDANSVARELSDKDCVFVDPPYSSVQYSRFYHVLETLAVGHMVEVSGAGRYPPSKRRPRSQYSLASASSRALKDLFGALGERGCGVIVTFPAGPASNGLSGDTVVSMAKDHFLVESARVCGRFSTLGGNHHNRSARRNTEELILTLQPN